MLHIHFHTEEGLWRAVWSAEVPGRPLTLHPDLLRGRVLAFVRLDDGTRLCGTGNDGLWRAERGGEWARVEGSPLTGLPVTALACGCRHRGTGQPVVWAGTEPSRVLRSEDGGATWSAVAPLDALPSADEWSYPPRPKTHHVRTLAPHPRDADTLLAGIEAGAVVSTRDGGSTWTDRVAHGPRDPHRMMVHPADPDRVLVAGGDGFAETWDFGRSWVRTGDGMEDGYVWDLAVETSEGRNMMVAASPDARRAHRTGAPRSRLYRRDLAPRTPESRDGLPRWREVTPEAPPIRERRAPALSPLPGAGDAYLVCTREGELAWTADAGTTWQEIRLDPSGAPEVRGLTVTPGD